MRKIALVIVAIMVMAFSAVSVSAAESPTTPTQPTTTTNPPATSPQTGAESSDALLFAGLAVAGCAGIAVVAKKRISE